MDLRGVQKAQEVLWRRVRISNLIERAFLQVKRGTRSMGVFCNRNSMERILYSVFLHLNSKGQEVLSLLFTQKAQNEHLRRTII